MKKLSEMIAVMQAALDGKPIQYKTAVDWKKQWNDIQLDTVSWDWAGYDYRIKPTPKRVPLGPEDVPPGSVVRKSEPHSMVKWWSVWCVTEYGAYFAMPSELNVFKWEYLMDSSFELSRDGGKTWKPFWKEVECDTK